MSFPVDEPVAPFLSSDKGDTVPRSFDRHQDFRAYKLDLLLRATRGILPKAERRQLRCLAGLCSRSRQLIKVLAIFYNACACTSFGSRIFAPGWLADCVLVCSCSSDAPFSSAVFRLQKPVRVYYSSNCQVCPAAERNCQIVTKYLRRGVELHRLFCRLPSSCCSVSLWCIPSNYKHGIITPL